ncbi:MAG: demethylmenaquinone methyltransferase [Propionibacteriaceae bacterium]|nr:demethylmenaquinone methyltransferase [Propionibacteriaceae bacterium]
MEKSEARATLERRRTEVAAMFDQVASRYDVMNDLLSLGQDRHWRAETVAAIDPRRSQRILDLAAGTGTSSVPFADKGAVVVPTDLSLGMLTVGKSKHPELPFVNADALALPFADHAFDAVTISFGLRNVEDTPAALAELRRVTRPGGRIVICEFSTPTWTPFRSVYHRYLVTALPKVAALGSSNPAAYDYLGESIRDWPDQRSLADLMSAAGWKGVGWKNLSGGIVALHRAHA